MPKSLFDQVISKNKSRPEAPLYSWKKPQGFKFLKTTIYDIEINKFDFEIHGMIICVSDFSLEKKISSL